MDCKRDDGLEATVRELSRVPDVRAVVLYGSHARGDSDEGSDIDLLIVFGTKRSMDEGYRKVIETLSGSHLLIHGNVLSLDELERADPHFLEAVFTEGKTLYQSKDFDVNVARLLRLAPFALVEYSLRGLAPREKTRLSFKLYGRRAGRYRYGGLVEELGGWRMGMACIAVPIGGLSVVERLLGERGVSYTTRIVWMTHITSSKEDAAALTYQDEEEKPP